MSAPQPPKGIPPNLKFIMGIFIMLCGWIICFDIFLLVIGIPFFLIGMLLVFLSKKSILVKCITVAIPIIAWFVCFEIILHEINKPSLVTILVPENYEGEFRIVEGEINGTVPSEENGRTLLIIPANGVLITQAHLNLHVDKGTEQFEYYYVNTNGIRTKLCATDINLKGATLPAITFNGVTSPPNDPGKSSDVARKLDYLYDSFIVFPSHKKDESNVNTDVTLNQDEWTALTDSLIKVERKIK